MDKEQVPSFSYHWKQYLLHLTILLCPSLTTNKAALLNVTLKRACSNLFYVNSCENYVSICHIISCTFSILLKKEKYDNNYIDIVIVEPKEPRSWAESKLTK
jgi:hypothetical protein